MTDILILSAPGDAARAHPITDALVEDRQDVRWLPVGADDGIGDAVAAVEAARCVILVWSATTTASQAERFRALARLAVRRGTAIGVRIARVDPPADLGAMTLYDLCDWRAAPPRWRRWLGGHLYMRDVVAAAKYKIANRDPPPPGAPRAMLLRQALATIPAVFALVALVPTALGFWRDLDLANPEEAREWAEVDRSDCAALKTFVAHHPDGKFAPDAQALLQVAGDRTETRWVSETRVMALNVPKEIDPVRGIVAAMPSRALAEDALAKRVAVDADRVCRTLARTGQARFVRYALPAAGVDRTCAASAEGWRCGFYGDLSCVQQEPRHRQVKDCRPTARSLAARAD